MPDEHRVSSREEQCQRKWKKIALITGGSRGMCAAIAEASGRGRSERGYHLHERRGRGWRPSSRMIERAGGKSDRDSGGTSPMPTRLKPRSKRRLQPSGRLDVLVNNAGTAIPKPFEEATLEEMDRVLDINVRGVFVATQAALKYMKSGGRVIMIRFGRG